jgi:hypothetical protein
MTGWPPKDWRAILALIFSVLGAVVLTALLWWGIAQLLPEKGWNTATEADRARAIRWALWIVAASIGLVLIGLGFAVNRRSLRGKWGDKSINWEGGDPPTSQ